MTVCALAAWGSSIGGCEQVAAPRAQLIVYVDTDLPTPQWADTLRAEVLDADGLALDTRTATNLDDDDWPLSLGAVSVDGEDIRLRLRLFPSSRTVDLAPTLSAADTDPSEPLPFFAIDRLVEWPAPTTVESIAVTLEGHCMGAIADPAAHRSCVGGTPRAASSGITPVTDAPTSVQGTWSEVQALPCDAAAPAVEGARCIEGGLFFWGDVRLATLPCADGCDPVPERAVHLSPFYMDQHEVTVGRFREALDAGFAPDGEWSAGPGCTFDAGGSRDDLPINCVDWHVADQFCRFAGGELPTEAQWEYVASGLGAENLYVWGRSEPNCDEAVYGRVLGVGGFGTAGECHDRGLGPQPFVVGERSADITPRGVVDLAGNVAEWVRDAYVPYSTACPGRDTRDDPICADPGSAMRVVRGADWASAAADLPAAHRRFACASGLDHDEGTCAPGTGGDVPVAQRIGFRCVYAGAAR